MPAIMNKICIDSRFKTFDSPSNSDFKIELKENYLVPENFGAVITDVCIPRSWYTVEPYNNKLYFRITNGGAISDCIAELDPQNYDIQTLADQIQVLMNTAAGVYNSQGIVHVFSALPLPTKGIIIIDCITGFTFQIFTDQDMMTTMKASWTGLAYDSSNLQSINGAISHVGISYECNPLLPFLTGFVNTLPYESIYITSNQLSTFENVGPAGQSNILKRITVDNTPFGSVISNPWMNELDFTNVSKQLLRTLHFRITDPYGNILNLHGAHVSFSIVFIQIPAEY